MIAFIAWTPLHVINILNTKNTYYPETIADLYIYNEFNGADIVFENIKKEKVFRNVYWVDYKKMDSPLMSKINILLNRNTMVELEDEIKYDIIFTQGGNYFLKILFGISKKNNSKTELRYIEDGLASYLNITLLNISETRKRIMNILNPYSMFLTHFSGYYLYDPTLSNIEEKEKMHKLPVITAEEELYTQLQRVFGINEERIKLKNAILFLDQPLEVDGYKVDETAIIETVKEYGGSRKLFVKLHPRTSPEKYDDSYQILKTSLPLELSFLAYDFDNTLVMSCISTASFTPKLMFGVENTFLLLTDMILNDSVLSSKDERTRNVFEGVSDFYIRYHAAGYNNVLMPPTKEVLRQLIMEDSYEIN